MKLTQVQVQIQEKPVGRPRSVDYAEMERLYNLVYTDDEIKKVLGCSKKTVMDWRKAEEAAPNAELRRWMERRGLIRREIVGY